MKHIISVDPSINFCGIAVHTLKGTLIYYNLIKPVNKSDDFIVKSYDIIKQIKEVMSNYEAAQLVLEIPTYWRLAGFVARESGSIFKLTFLCGMICGLTDDTICVTPEKWKGQMNKKVVANRLNKIKQYNKINIKKLDNNIMDSIAIGYYYFHGKI